MFVEGGACAMAQWPVQACPNIQSPANYHSYIVFCHVLRKRTLHNVNHQHEDIQILQLLLNTYIHHCTVKRRSKTSDISECERHCQQNLREATEGKKNSSIRMNDP